MLKTSDLMTWFQGQGVDIAFSMDQLPSDDIAGGPPKRVCAISISGGLGLEYQDALVKPTFQLLTRGVNGRDAETLAFALDTAWIDAEPSFYIGDSRVLGKGRLGGPPSFVAATTSDDLYPGLVIRAATYWCRIER